MQQTLVYDMYLAGHLGTLVEKIRCRALKQYTMPFDALLLPTMAEAFAVDVTALEQELAGLIMKGEIHARIDSQNKVSLLSKMGLEPLQNPNSSSHVFGSTCFRHSCLFVEVKSCLAASSAALSMVHSSHMYPISAASN